MKFIEKSDGINSTYKLIFWGDHWPGCEKCRDVSIDNPRSFPGCCALGAALLQEELAIRQAPIVKKEAQEVKEWAKRMGTFKIK